MLSLSLSDSLPHPIMLSHPLSRSLPEVYLLREDRLRRGCVNCLSISLSLFLSLSFPPSRPPFLSLTHSLPHPRERLVSYCRTTSASTAPRTPRRTCCPYAYVLTTVPRVSRSCEFFRMDSISTSYNSRDRAPAVHLLRKGTRLDIEPRNLSFDRIFL